MNPALNEYETVLEACRDRHCRLALAVLLNEHRPVTLRDITSAIVERDPDIAAKDPPNQTFEQVYLTLYHSHLPKLAANGFIEFDHERQVIEPTPKFDELQPCLSSILDAGPSLDLAPKNGI